MKKHAYLLVFLLLSSLAVAQDNPGIWPMPSPLPSAPQGKNPAAYPLPRLDWFKRVINNNDKARPEASQIKLIFDGDSITDGWQTKGHNVWAERYGRLDAFDFGIGGDRTENVLWRLYQGQVDGIHPRLIALMIGTNNLSSNKVEEIVEGIQTIVADYQKRCPEAVILLQGIFPRGNLPTDPFRAKIRAINEVISKLGDGKRVIYIDFGNKFLEPDGTLSAEVMPDYLHPSEKGYRIWADAIQPVIDKYLPQK